MLPACCHKTWVRMMFVFLLGGIGALSLPPFPLWMLPALVISLSGFWLILTSFEKLLHGSLAGFLFGFGYFLAGIWWVGNALLVGGNPYLWALPLAVCGLQALLALFPLMAALTTRWLSQGRSLTAYLLFLSMMGFWEWGRGNFFTGFPWNLFGMAWTYSLPMLQLLSIGGIYLLSLLTIFIASLPAFLLWGQASKAIKTSLSVLAGLALCGTFLWGQQRLGHHQTAYNTDVVLQVVTPNIPQEDKWDTALFWDNFTKTVNAISLPASDISGKTRVIVLPETALHYAALEDMNARAKLRSALEAYPEKTYLLTGLLRRSVTADDTEAYHNSLVGLDAALTDVMTFDKFHLVPFGEYMPLQQYIPIGPVIGFSGFSSGAGPETKSLTGLPPFSPLVCYEVIFPGEVTAHGQEDQPRPEWMVNVTNDAWYGVSPGPYQHLGQSMYRAIEEGLPMVRATNTGFSAVFDPLGRTLEQTGLFQASSQISYLPRPLDEPPFFARTKHLIFFLSLLILALPALWIKIRRSA